MAQRYANHPARTCPACAGQLEARDAATAEWYCEADPGDPRRWQSWSPPPENASRAGHRRCHCTRCGAGIEVPWPKSAA